MKGLKNIDLANFNCTFGEEDEPMGKYFFEILYPALKMGYERKSTSGTYYIDNINIDKIDGLGYVLIGTHIYKTILEKKSDYNPESGLRTADVELETSPYSAFILILKNHRIIHIRNQKGSPQISWLGTTIRDFVEKYVNEINKGNDKEKLPFPKINIIDIPVKKEINKIIKKVDKINKVKFSFVPLNGDIDVSDYFNKHRKLLEETQTNTSNINLNTPGNKDRVVDIVEEAGDLIKTRIDVTMPNGDKRIIENNDFRERISLYLPEENEMLKNIIYVAEKLSGRDVLKNASEENINIYNKYILPVIKDKNKK